MHVRVLLDDAALWALFGDLAEALARGGWLLLDVRDVAGAPALGATVRVELGNRVLTRIVRSDGSYMTARDPRVHVGVGDLEEVPALEIEWPDGRSRRMESVQVDRVIRIDPPEPAS